jgi:NADH-quinone oxidoreductase subunit A
MQWDFAGILVFLIVGFLFVYALILIARLLSRHNPTAGKLSTYECGETPVGSSWVQFNIRFYVIALIFIIFDVEVAFIYPCAVVFKDWILHGRGLTAFLEIAIFVVILLAGLAYVWAKGDLNWVKTISEEPQDDSETRRSRIA